MRFLISTMLLVGATALACHGLFNDEAAWKAYDGLTGASPTVERLHAGSPLPTSRDELIRTWPYTSAASRARADILEAWEQEKPAPAQSGVAAEVWSSIRESGFVQELPFAFPPGAAAVALAALLLGIVMPRTRFRDFMIAFLVLGALACWPALAPPADQITYVSWFGPVRHLVAWFPQIAVGLMFVAGVLLVGKRRAAADVA